MATQFDPAKPISVPQAGGVGQAIAPAVGALSSGAANLAQAFAAAARQPQYVGGGRSGYEDVGRGIEQAGAAIGSGFAESGARARMKEEREHERYLAELDAQMSQRMQVTTDRISALAEVRRMEAANVLPQLTTLGNYWAEGGDLDLYSEQDVAQFQGMMGPPAPGTDTTGVMSKEKFMQLIADPQGAVSQLTADTFRWEDQAKQQAWNEFANLRFKTPEEREAALKSGALLPGALEFSEYANDPRKLDEDWVKSLWVLNASRLMNTRQGVKDSKKLAKDFLKMQETSVLATEGLINQTNATAGLLTGVPGGAVSEAGSPAEKAPLRARAKDLLTTTVQHLHNIAVTGKVTSFKEDPTKTAIGKMVDAVFGKNATTRAMAHDLILDPAAENRAVDTKKYHPSLLGGALKGSSMIVDEAYAMLEEDPELLATIAKDSGLKLSKADLTKLRDLTDRSLSSYNATTQAVLSLDPMADRLAKGKNVIDDIKKKFEMAVAAAADEKGVDPEEFLTKYIGNWGDLSALLVNAQGLLVPMEVIRGNAALSTRPGLQEKMAAALEKLNAEVFRQQFGQAPAAQSGQPGQPGQPAQAPMIYREGAGPRQPINWGTAPQGAPVPSAFGRPESPSDTMFRQ